MSTFAKDEQTVGTLTSNIRSVYFSTLFLFKPRLPTRYKRIATRTNSSPTMSNPQANNNVNDESDLIASTSTSTSNLVPDQVDIGGSTPPTGSNTAEAAGKKGIAKLIADGTFQTTKRKAGRADIVKKTMGPVHGG